MGVIRNVQAFISLIIIGIIIYFFLTLDIFSLVKTSANFIKNYTPFGLITGLISGDKITRPYKVANCPKGSINTGPLCSNMFTRDTFDDVFSDGWSNCRKKYGLYNCEKVGLRIGPTCKNEANYLGYEKPEEYINFGLTCQMASKIGKVGICSKEYPYINTEFGLCYGNCPKGYNSTTLGTMCQKK